MENIESQELITDKYTNMYKNNQLAFEFVKEKENAAYLQIDNFIIGKNFNINVNGKIFSSFDNLSSTDYMTLMDYLLELLNETDDPAKIVKIKKMIAELYAKNIQNNAEKPSKNNEQPKYAKTESDLPKQKAADYQEYAEKQLKREIKTPEITIDTSKFEKFTDKQLFEFYKTDKFYKLSKEDQMALLQTSVNRYLDAAGVERVPISLDYGMTLDDRFVEYGNYKPSHQTIFLNGNLFNNVEQNEGNIFLPLKLLSTVVHEARHHIQFSKFQFSPANKVEELIQKSMQQSQANLSFKEYLAAPDELDARNAALEFMRIAAVETNDINFAAFYNLEKQREQNNKKSPAPQTMINDCQDIYNKQIKFDVNNYYVSRLKEQQSSFLINAQGFNNYVQKVKKPY